MRVQLLTNMGAVVAVSVRSHETATATATATTMLQQLLQHACTQMQLLLSDEPHLHFIGRTGRHEPDKLTPFYSLYFTRLQLYQVMGSSSR